MGGNIMLLLKVMSFSSIYLKNTNTSDIYELKKPMFLSKHAFVN